MIIDENIRKLVEKLRALAERHEKHDWPKGDRYMEGQHDGRKDAYNLAAVLLEELIPDEEADNEQGHNHRSR